MMTSRNGGGRVAQRSLTVLAGGAVACALLLPSLPASTAGLDIGGSGNEYFLSDTFSATANTVFAYGRPDDTAYFGDWDGNGTDTPMVRRVTTFYARNSNTTGSADRVLSYGLPGDIVLAGDWDGNGTDTLAVRRGNLYYLRNTLSSGVADQVIAYGRPDDVVLVGDWDGNGTDTLAVRRGNLYYLRNTLSSGVADQVIAYGRPDDVVLIGDWDGNGTDTLAVRRGNIYYVRISLTSGIADFEVAYGRPTDTAFAGDWNGDGTDSLGIRRPPPPPVNPPLFAYGSLRHGESGYYLLDGRTTAEYATRMPRLDLYRLSTSSYPYAVPNSGADDGIVGEVMVIRPELYAAVLASLDRYERYNPYLPPDSQVYVRQSRPTREGVNSWVYMSGPRQADYLLRYGILITSGDWLRW